MSTNWALELFGTQQTQKPKKHKSLNLSWSRLTWIMINNSQASSSVYVSCPSPTYRCITLSIILQLTKCKSSFYYYVKYFKRIFQFDDMFAGRSKSTRKCDLMEHVGRGRTTADPERYHHHLREMVVFLSWAEAREENICCKERDCFMAGSENVELKLQLINQRFGEELASWR